MGATAGRTTLGVITFAALAAAILTLGSNVPATDPCFLNCSGNGVCLNSSNSSACVCDACYNGSGCEIECSGHGTCSNSSVCVCDDGFSGTQCETSTPLDLHIGVAPTKLIVLDKPSASKQKLVYVAKDQVAGITKGAGTDPDQISVRFDVRYDDDAAAGTIELPAGALNGVDGWKVNNAKAAKYVNKVAPSGPTSAKVGVIKPNKLLKLSSKGLGVPPFDIVGAGAPSGSVFTAYCVNNGGERVCHCSELTECAYKPLTGGGAKLVCRVGVPDPTCQALEAAVPTCPGGGAAPPAVCANASTFCAALNESCRPCILSGSGNSSFNLEQCVSAVCSFNCSNSSANDACTDGIITAGCEAECCGF